MQLTDAQLAEYHEQGYLFLPGRFTSEEIAPLRAEAERLFGLPREEVWRENQRRTPHGIRGAHVQRGVPTPWPAPRDW